MEGFIFGILQYLNFFASQVLLGGVVQKVDESIHWINLYPVGSVISFFYTYQLDSYYPMDGAIQRLKNWGLVYYPLCLLNTFY